MRIVFALAVSILVSPPLLAQYRCTEGGKTTITDRPCVGSPSPTQPANTKVIGDQQNSAYSSTHGAWRGQVQFMAKSGTLVINEAHTVVPLVIELDPQGKVTGTSNGCTFKGIAAPGSFDTITMLDVTLTGCQFAGFNRQMTGRLALYKAQKYVDFSRKPPANPPCFSE